MSFFLGMAPMNIRRDARPFELVRLAFPPPLTFVELEKSPFADALRGERPGRTGFLITAGSSSRDVLGLGRERASALHTFSSGLEKVIAACGGCSLLLHWFRSDIRTERIAVRRSETVLATDFFNAPIRLEQDVRYSILSAEGLT